MSTKVQLSLGRSDPIKEAGLRLLQVYATLAKRGQHLLEDLLLGQPPMQWAHYPENDASDEHGYQWFYHSHSPLDRSGAKEHGHIHLFARRSLWGRRLQSGAELAFWHLCGQPQENPPTRHLLTIGFDAKGLPISLFTVNSWVTGDLMLGRDLTLNLLERMILNTGHDALDTVITAVVQLCRDELRELLTRRDATLAEHTGTDKLHDQEMELLSEIPIDLDNKLRSVTGSL